MKNVKIVSSILFIISRILAVIYLAIAFYAAFTMLTGWSFEATDNNLRFAIHLPFTQKPFLLGENHLGYKLFNFLIPLGGYGVFFWVVSSVFKVFMQPKLFTENGVRQLTWFYAINIFVPPFNLLMASIFAREVEEGMEGITVIHFILGIFAYFLAAIFKQGVTLQKEQDLFI